MNVGGEVGTEIFDSRFFGEFGHVTAYTNPMRFYLKKRTITAKGRVKACAKSAFLCEGGQQEREATHGELWFFVFARQR